MSKFFDLDNPLFSVINKFVDLLFLSVIVDVICLPALFFGFMTFMSFDSFNLLNVLVFILCSALVGPALTAMYYSVAKSVRRERGYAVKEFFKSYKNNFVQGAVITVIYALLGTVLYLDIYVTEKTDMVQFGETMTFIMNAVFRAVIVLLCLVSVYIFPVLSRFSMKLKAIINTSFMMSIRHLPKTLLLVLIAATASLGPVGLAYLLGASEMDSLEKILEAYFSICLPFYLIFPAGGCLLCSLVLEKIFKLYMKPAEEGEEDTSEDRWYLE